MWLAVDMRWAPCFLASIPGTRWLRIKWRLKVVQSPGTTISVYHLRYTISAKLLIFSNAPAIGPQTHSSSYQNSQYETSSETAKIRYTIYFNAATGSFKLIAPNLLRVQCPRRFWDSDPWKFAHVFNVPASSLLREFFFPVFSCFSPDIRVFVFSVIFGS